MGSGAGLYKAADLLFRLKRIPAARGLLVKLAEFMPQYPGVHRALAKMAQVEHDKAGALAEMKQEIANHPEDPKFKIDLGELLMSYEDFQAARLPLSEVANLPPAARAPEYIYDKIRAYLLLARCFRAQNHLESAEGAITLARELDPNDPELIKEYGYIEAGLFHAKEAASAFESYLQRVPAAADAPQIQKWIESLQIAN